MIHDVRMILSTHLMKHDCRKLILFLFLHLFSYSRVLISVLTEISVRIIIIIIDPHRYHSHSLNLINNYYKELAQLICEGENLTDGGP